MAVQVWSGPHHNQTTTHISKDELFLIKYKTSIGRLFLGHLCSRLGVHVCLEWASGAPRAFPKQPPISLRLLSVTRRRTHHVLPGGGQTEDNSPLPSGASKGA